MAFEYPSLLDAFERAVSEYGDRIAVKDGAATLTYTELDRAASRLAGHLMDRLGDVPQPVAMVVEPSAAALVAMVGVLKSGHFMLPLDPSWPQQRAAAILDDAGARMLLTRPAELHIAAALASDGIELLDVEHPPADPAPYVRRHVPGEALYSVMYTSGTTGTPKGVLQANANYYTSLHRHPPFPPGEIRAENASAPSYILGVSGPFKAWLAGGVVLPFRLRGHTARAFADWIRQERVTDLKLMPSPFRNLMAVLDEGEVLESVRAVRLTGEPLLPRDVRLFARHFSRECLLHFSYGMTETQMISVNTVARERAEEYPLVPAGIPGENTRVSLRDEQGRDVPAGETGEVYVTSRFVSPGYWRQPERTAASFSPHPDDPQLRTYRTGDLAYWLPDGQLMHLGRKDSQIKIRGQRVMAAEVEVAIRELPNVKSAVVIARQPPAGDTRLVAYVVPRVAPFDAPAARRALAEGLPAAMVPTVFVELDHFPTLISGKVDLRKLPEPDWGERRVHQPLAAPRDETQAVLVELWQDALGVRPIGIHDDYFDLGGESVMAAKIFAEIEARLGISAPISMLVETPTIASLAEALRSLPAEPRGIVVALGGSGAKRPIFLVHVLGGTVMNYQSMARALGEDQPVYGLEAVGVDGRAQPRTSIEAMAADYVAAVRERQPRGPYVLGGHCLGGVVAFETARQLEAMGEDVSALLLIDSWTPGVPSRIDAMRAPTRFVPNLARWLRRYGLRYAGRRVQQTLRPPARNGYARLELEVEDVVAIPEHVSPELRGIVVTQILAMRAYQPTPIRAPIYLFRVALQPLFRTHQHDYGWSDFTAGGVRVRVVEGDHRSVILNPANARKLAGALAESLDGRAQP